MTFTINGAEWALKCVRREDSELLNSQGMFTLGVTDNTKKTVFIAEDLTDTMRDKVLCHELTHVYCFENHTTFDIHTEEIIADFMSLFGRDIIYLADELMEKFLKKVA